jgi:hypothetical protein
MTQPIVHVADYGAKGDGVTDDSDAINRAIAAMRGGGTLVFDPGRVYLKRKHILVRTPGVRLWGYGAVLYAYVTDAEVAADSGPGSGRNASQISIQLLAPGTSIYGFAIVSNLRKRLTGTQAHPGVFVASDANEVIDNRFEYTQNGVRVRGQRKATSFVIARNVVYRTTSDGITVSGPSFGGRVLCNVVRETGDDMISVLNYGVGEPNDVARILIEANDVAGQYWGRGVTVHGGRDVTIRGNTIARTSGAGIFVRGGADTYKMANVRNVLIDANTITDVETTMPVHNPLKPLKEWRVGTQAAIDISGPGEVSEVLVRNNLISRARYDGIRITGNAHRIGLDRNQLSGIGRSPISNTAQPGALACSDNVNDGVSVSDGRCGNGMPRIIGSGM